MWSLRMRTGDDAPMLIAQLSLRYCAEGVGASTIAQIRLFLTNTPFLVNSKRI